MLQLETLRQLSSYYKVDETPFRPLSINGHVTHITYWLQLVYCSSRCLTPFERTIFFGLVEWNERRLVRRCLKIQFLWYLIQHRFINECRYFGQCIVHIFKVENIKEESTLYRTFEIHLTKRKVEKQEEYNTAENASGFV
jgi:hypothetical protein